jgi:DNA-binding winged helix-turn-helix (wHTH) protein/Tol biopolymer transport system component
LSAKIKFGVYELDCAAMELRKHGMPIRLQDQPLRVLAALIERPGEIVTREELKDRIWAKDTFVDFDQSLNKAVNRVREILNDDANQPKYVETIPRRGYRFIAPVIGSMSSNGQKGTVSDGPGDSSSGKSARSIWVAGLVLVAVVMTASVVGWLRKPQKPLLREPKRITAGFQPALSGDGKLLAYASSIGSETVAHIWVQQTDGNNAIPITNGPDPDFAPDFSPDGTLLAFYSAKDGGGIRVTPTLQENAKFAVKCAFCRPRFSPKGDKILFSDNDGAFTLSLDGGQPVPLALDRNFQVDGPVLWGPSGEKVIFYGYDKNETAKTYRWWIAPLISGEPTAVNLPGLLKDTQPHRAIRAWIRSKSDREWIIYSNSTSTAWKLFRIRVSAKGETEGEPEQLVAGSGAIDSGGSASADGKFAYSTYTTTRSIFEIPTNDRGLPTGPVIQLRVSEQSDDQSPYVSHDGRWMAYNTSGSGTGNSILLRDMKNGTDRLIDDQGVVADNRATGISPDGSRSYFRAIASVASMTGGREEPRCLVLS